ncbi:MAG: amino acid ABC transporter permease [Corynebacteriales bacterium]|nr:amino acid ABC transporter permease [Mycobacteriales bacterium]
MKKDKPQATVLYDAPGPRARTINLVGSVVIGILLIFLAYQFVYVPLDEKEQFSGELWGPLLDPSNENFDRVWRRLGDGLVNTLKAAALAIVASFICGMALAVLRIQLKSLMTRRFLSLHPVLRYTLRTLSWILNGVTRFCVEVFRGLPVIITIFFVSRLTPEIANEVWYNPVSYIPEDPMWYVVIGLTIYNMVVIAEILRSGMEGLPGGQKEAASSLGLSSFQTTRLILLPQSLKIMLPALISQLVVILKDTSLGALISYTELLNVGKQVIGVLDNPLQTYTVVAVIYILLNYSLSKLAQYAQYRLSRSRNRPKKLPKAPPTVAPMT